MSLNDCIDCSNISSSFLINTRSHNCHWNWINICIFYLMIFCTSQKDALKVIFCWSWFKIWNFSKFSEINVFWNSGFWNTRSILLYCNSNLGVDHCMELLNYQCQRMILVRIALIIGNTENRMQYQTNKIHKQNWILKNKRFLPICFLSLNFELQINFNQNLRVCKP